MVAGNVVPRDAVIVEVIEDGNASLVGPGFPELSVVGLGLLVSSGPGPVASPAEGGVGGGNSSGGPGPEPPVDNGGLEVGPVAAVEVTLAPRSPNVLDVAGLDLLVDETSFVLGFETHQILTMFSEIQN